jgi:universal stress protein F
MYKNIVVPIDLSDKQLIKAILPPTLNLVNAFGAELHLLHIIPDFGTKLVEDYLPKNWMSHQKEKCEDQLQEMVRKYLPQEIKVKCHVGRGAVYDEVINYSNTVNADLIIISAVRPQLRDYMLGPNASKIVRHSSISVLVVREE